MNNNKKEIKCGRVYIFTNPSFRNNIIKIGTTDRSVEIRAKELDTTGVPEPFELYAYLEINNTKDINAKKIEQEIHKFIDVLNPNSRVRQHREFFEIEPEKILDIFRFFANIYNWKVIYGKDEEVYDRTVKETFNDTYKDDDILFSKIINFNDDCIPLNNLNTKSVNSVLLFGNLGNLLGESIDKHNLSDNMKHNKNMFKKLIKNNPNIMFHIWGNRSMRQYFERILSSIGINMQTNISFESINSKEDLINKISNMKFDIAIVNPPYKGTFYIDVLLELFPHITKQYIGVHPLTYCMYSQSEEHNSISFKKMLSSYETHIYIKNPLDYFPYDAYIGQIFGITYVDKTKTSKLFLNEIEKSGFDRIESYADGNETLQMIQELLKPLYMKDNVANHIYSSNTAKYKKIPSVAVDDDTYVIQMTRSAGSQNDFYSRTSKTLIIAAPNKDLNPIKKFKDFDGEFYINTESKSLDVAKRIKETLKTDFMRMTLFVTKPTNELATCINNENYAVMRMMPWFDWNDGMFDGTYQEINDRLFEKYIPSDIRTKLKDVLSKELPSVY